MLHRILTRVPKLKLLGLSAVIMTLSIVAAACGDTAPAPAPVIDTAAITSAVQKAIQAAPAGPSAAEIQQIVKSAVPAPVAQVSATDIKQMVESAMASQLSDAPPVLSPEELKEMVETAVAVAAPAGTDPKVTAFLVESAVKAAQAAVTKDDMELLIAKAVADAAPEAASGLVAADVEDIVAKTLAASGGSKDVIRFHDGQWQSLWVNNALAMYVIEKGYGYPVESVEGTTVTMQVALPRGDLDVNMEMWRSNIIDWVNKEVSQRTIVDLGQIFEFSGQGFYVPTYVIEGDADRGIVAVAPDLKGVSQLHLYKELFADPEDPSKGVLINCIIGWQCQMLNRIKINTYLADDGTPLSDHYNIMEPGAAAGLDAAIAGAYKNGEPILSYYWEPTWILGAYKMTLLEEPTFTDECNSALQLAKETFTDESVSTEACAFEEFDIHKFASTNLLSRAPEVAAFLSRMFVGTQMVNDLSAYMESNKLTAEETASYFFKTYEDKWKGWVPEDIFFKVKGSLVQ